MLSSGTGRSVFAARRGACAAAAPAVTLLRVRVLFSSTRGAGHFNPLVPFARAFERAGHEVMCAGPPDLAGPVDGAGFEFWQFDPPPEDELGVVWGRVPELPPEEANEVVIGEIFGRLNSTASLPGLRAACEEWRPDAVVRDPNEYGSAVAAELHGIPHARVAIGLASSEELGLGIAAGAIDAIRQAEGLPPDPGAEVLRRSPYLSVFPQTLDEGAQPDTHRLRDPAWGEPSGELPDWWPGRDDDPLVYVTFGSVAGSFSQALPVYDVAMRAVAELPVKVLLTVGRDLDLDALPNSPDNVRIERWVPQQDVLGHAAAAVVHGGSGSTLGAIAAGVPLVVIPLFADQPQNARRVAEVGAGLAVEPNRDDLDATVTPLRQAVETVLAEASYRDRARSLADELRAEPPVDEAVPLFEGFARS
jgi:UDP:flavonoid glycosyltransferase YjiC (YdhE family)